MKVLLPIARFCVMRFNALPAERRANASEALEKGAKKKGGCIFRIHLPFFFGALNQSRTDDLILTICMGWSLIQPYLCRTIFF